jgi:hypothetical protein
MLIINWECIIVVFVLLHKGRFDLISFQSQLCKSSSPLSTKVYINLPLFIYWVEMASWIVVMDFIPWIVEAHVGNRLLIVALWGMASQLALVDL